MRPRIAIIGSRAARRCLEALVADGNAAQEHVWPAQIVLLSTDGVGMNEIKP